MLSSNLREDLARLFEIGGRGRTGGKGVNFFFVGARGLTAVVPRSFAPFCQHAEMRPLARTDFLNQVKVHVNGKDLIVNAHRRHIYLIADFGLDINVNEYICPYVLCFFCSNISYNHLKNLSDGLFDRCHRLQLL